MTVTEFAVLEACAPYTADSPIIRAFLDKVAQRQAAWSGYPLLFFRHSKTPAIIFLISGWKDIPAHNEWIVSEGNQELLREAQEILGVNDFHHLEINFETMPPNVSGFTWEVLPGGEAQGVGASGNGSTSEAVWEGAGKVLDGDEEQIYRLRGYVAPTEDGTDLGGLKAAYQPVTTDNVSETQRSVVTMHRLSLP